MLPLFYFGVGKGIGFQDSCDGSITFQDSLDAFFIGDNAELLLV